MNTCGGWMFVVLPVCRLCEWARGVFLMGIWWLLLKAGIGKLAIWAGWGGQPSYCHLQWWWSINKSGQWLPNYPSDNRSSLKGPTEGNIAHPRPNEPIITPNQISRYRELIRLGQALASQYECESVWFLSFSCIHSRRKCSSQASELSKKKSTYQASE